jgi:hypothetical protein
MSKLGSPISSAVVLSSPEIRVGPMALAMKMVQSTHSMGVLQNATVQMQITNTDLLAGQPKEIIATAMSQRVTTIAGNAYEYSARNLMLMAGEGVPSVAPAALVGLATATAAAAATSITTDMTTANSVVAGDIVTIQSATDPAKVTVARIASANTTGAWTLDSDTPLLFAVAVGDHVFRTAKINLGASSSSQYFAVHLLGTDNGTGLPIQAIFWKCAIEGGMNVGFSADNWAVTPFTLKVLTPSVADYTTGALLPYADIIPNAPTGVFLSPQ